MQVVSGVMPFRLQSSANFLRRDVIANQRILEIGAPVDVHRAGMWPVS
jgi:hypothetical protein